MFEGELLSRYLFEWESLRFASSIFFRSYLATQKETKSIICSDIDIEEEWEDSTDFSSF